MRTKKNEKHRLTRSLLEGNGTDTLASRIEFNKKQSSCFRASRGVVVHHETHTTHWPWPRKTTKTKYKHIFFKKSMEKHYFPIFCRSFSWPAVALGNNWIWLLFEGELCQRDRTLSWESHRERCVHTYSNGNCAVSEWSSDVTASHRTQRSRDHRATTACG